MSRVKVSHVDAAIQLDKSGTPQPRADVAEKKKPTLTQPSVDGRQPIVDSRQSSVNSHQPEQETKKADAAQRPVATDHRPPNADAQPAVPKTRSWGNVKLSNVIPDLNNILTDKSVDEEITDEPELLSGTERQPFDHDLLLQHWHALA